MNKKIIALFKSGAYFMVCWWKNNKSSFLMNLLWPYLWIGFMYGFGKLFGSVEAFKSNVGINTHPILFYAYCTIAAFSSLAVFGDVASKFIWLRWEGLLEYIMLSPNSILLIALGDSLIPYLTTNILLGLEVFPLMIYVEGFKVAIFKLLALYGLLIIGSLPLFGLATILASLTLGLKEETNIFAFLNPLILILSGIFYPITVFPRLVQYIAKALPQTYLFEVARTLSRIGMPEVATMILALEALFLLTALYNTVSYPITFKAENFAKRRGAI